jgi:hypothetical protein
VKEPGVADHVTVALPVWMFVKVMSVSLTGFGSETEQKIKHWEFLWIGHTNDLSN